MKLIIWICSKLKILYLQENYLNKTVLSLYITTLCDLFQSFIMDLQGIWRYLFLFIGCTFLKASATPYIIIVHNHSKHIKYLPISFYIETIIYLPISFIWGYLAQITVFIFQSLYDRYQNELYFWAMSLDNEGRLCFLLWPEFEFNKS